MFRINVHYIHTCCIVCVGVCAVINLHSLYPHCTYAPLLLQSISDSELEQELGITNSLHRLKLRLAVHEIVSTTSSNKLRRTVSALMYYNGGTTLILYYLFPDISVWRDGS